MTNICTGLSVFVSVLNCEETLIYLTKVSRLLFSHSGCCHHNCLLQQDFMACFSVNFVENVLGARNLARSVFVCKKDVFTAQIALDGELFL